MKEVYDNGEKLAEYRHTPGGMLLSQRHGPLQVSYGYDRDKNLTALKALIYEYDGFNRAVKAETFDGNIQRYELEENGRLVQFIFHQSEVITEQNETDTIRLIRGYDLIASDAQSARTYYHYASDEVGSTTHIIDEKGKVLNRYVYDAFGNITEQEETVPNRFKFNGQQFDPITQQYYLRARFYNPVVARFTQEDVYRGDGLNLYAYCHNNPVVYADPSGYDCNAGAAHMEGQRDRNGQTDLPTSDPRASLPKPGDDIVKQANEHLGEIAKALHDGTPLTAEQTQLLRSCADAFGDPRLAAADASNPLARAMKDLDSAQNLYDSLPNSQKDRVNGKGDPVTGRTVAVLEGTTATGEPTGEVAGLSGFSHGKIGQSHKDNFNEIGYEAVRDYALEIKDPLTPQGSEKAPGYNNGSHGEKKAGAAIGGAGGLIDTGGVTRPMCPDCVTFYGAVSYYQGTNIYMAAAGSSDGSRPGQIHIFLPNKTHIASNM